jgi:gliding motility-associated-like protein
MPRKLCLSFISLFLLFSIAAIRTMGQINCVPVFVKEYSATGQVEPGAIKSLADGSQIIVGRGTATPTSDYDGMVTKVASDGTFLWSYLIGGSSDDVFTGITPLSDGSFLLFGNTSSFGHPEGKAWLVHITSAGAVIWSKQLGSAVIGIDRMKAVQQFTDGDIIGTLNVNDSTSSSNPIVFKMGLDGTIRWAHEFDNGANDSFTGLGFAGSTIYAGGFYTITTRHAVIVKINSGDGSLISSQNIYRDDDTYQEEISGLEVFNNMVSYGLWILKAVPPGGYINDIVLIRTDLSDNVLYSLYVQNSLDSVYMIPHRTKDNGFVVLKTITQDGPPIMVKFNLFGSADWGVGLSPNNFFKTNYALDITPDGGCVAAGYYNTYYTANLNILSLIRTDNAGYSGGCVSTDVSMFTDTLASKSTSFTWQSQSATTLSLNETINPVAKVFSNTTNNICQNSLCTDATPLPPACDKTYRIEYSADKSTFFRDVVTTTDGGRIAVGDIENDGLIMKFNTNGDVAWAKGYDEFFHNMILMRILRSQDNNFFVFGNNYVTLNHGVSGFTTIMKIDNNGNILWSKNLIDSYLLIFDVTATQDGGFAAILNDDYPLAGGTDYVMKFDANANVVWQKKMTNVNTNPQFKSIAANGNAIFVGFDNSGFSYGNVDEFGVEKLDLASGNFLWGNRYSSGSNGNFLVNRIFVMNDTSYLFMTNYSSTAPFGTAQNTVMARLDASGNLINGLALQGNYIVPVQTYYYPDASSPNVTLSPSFDFVLTNRVITATDTALNISRFTKDGSLLWSRNYNSMKEYLIYNIHPQANGFIITGGVSAPHQLNAFTNAFLLKVDSTGQIIPNAGADCMPTNGILNSSATPITLNEPITAGSANTQDISSAVANVFSQAASVDATAFCNLPANCNTVLFKQRGTGCSLADTLVYFLQNASNCDAAATWQFSPAYFKNGVINGDSVELIPLQAGSSTVTANIEGNCSLTIKNITASIGISARNVNLGNDTAICKGQTFKINAGGGYATYLWNDNSSDSVLSASSPGKYYVTVTDWCGNTGSDTIQISSVNDSFHITGDSIKCNNDIVLLMASSGYSNYQWSPSSGIRVNSDSAFVAPTSNTEYSVNAKSVSGCIVSDSVLITVLTSPLPFIGNDTSICTGDSLMLNAGPDFTHYKWNTGDSSQIIYVKQKATYSVAVTFNNGCITKDTLQLINLYKNPDPELNKDLVLCAGGGTKQLDAGNYKQYLWNDGSTASSLIVSDTGKYWVSVEDNNGCKGSDTASVRTISPLPSGFLPADTTICQYGKLTIIPSRNYDKYLWSDSSTKSSITISQPGLYSLQVTDSNDCVGQASILVSQQQCLVDLFVPNAFTPNGDGHNEIFKPLVFGNATKFKFAIYDRWGQKVFESKVPSNGWDGKINGVPAKSDTFVWYCEYQLDGQPEKIAKGTVILIR